jgi:hypothetical protein
MCNKDHRGTSTKLSESLVTPSASPSPLQLLLGRFPFFASDVQTLRHWAHLQVLGRGLQTESMTDFSKGKSAR